MEEFAMYNHLRQDAVYTKRIGVTVLGLIFLTVSAIIAFSVLAGHLIKPDQSEFIGWITASILVGLAGGMFIAHKMTYGTFYTIHYPD